MNDDKLKKSQDAGREDRAGSDRKATEDRTVSESERLEMFRGQLMQAALPDLPKISGYHVCWLTTSNPRDSIHARQRYGYEPIRASDMPGFDLVTMKTGEWAGCIGVNEMVAFKVPESLYQMYMKEAHHDAPNREQERLSAVLDTIRESSARDKTKVFEEDGTKSLRETAPAPTFAS